MTPPDSPEAPLQGDALTESLTVAMAVAPGVYSRNLFFELHRRPEVRAARKRGALLRGVLRHLGEAEDLTFTPRADGRLELRYRLARLAFVRAVELSCLEAACLRYLARRAGRGPFGNVEDGAEDRALVEATLARLGPPRAGVSPAAS